MLVSLRMEGCAEAADARIALGPAYLLLDALGRTGSLQGAAGDLAISYRSAWGQIAALERALGRPVVVKTKGHGTALTPFGRGLHGLLDESHRRLAPTLVTERDILADGLRRLMAAAPPRLRLAASHDPLLVEAVEAGAEIDLTVAGSLDALARLATGSVDAAGFHFGAEGAAPAPFAALFRDPALTIVPLFRREQGLMLAAGNPLELTGLADIAARRARFVNRQRGAGTRIWFERLCAEAGVAPDAILGHQTEEFTHQAVAALIATAAADAGMGTRDVAARFGLAYRPLGWETYFLAARTGLDPGRLAPLRAALRSRAARLPGYAPPPDAPASNPA